MSGSAGSSQVNAILNPASSGKPNTCLIDLSNDSYPSGPGLTSTLCTTPLKETVIFADEQAGFVKGKAFLQSSHKIHSVFLSESQQNEAAIEQDNASGHIGDKNKAFSKVLPVLQLLRGRSSTSQPVRKT
eukprot:CAMPEP_0177603034 /NCGR_PEP_ID=MMETSP0419_2-20121207/15258_1 /TAXON_ID=582737 /ORGANISM="Tetraselmis sp., Strain GSL018" /LENGTH=129 /DNA_ID=CAMNT_0019096701 /DNA_START=553 /DNA_END=942 /DNA_ORIENTATION=+